MGRTGLHPAASASFYKIYSAEILWQSKLPAKTTLLLTSHGMSLLGPRYTHMHSSARFPSIAIWYPGPLSTYITSNLNFG